MKAGPDSQPAFERVGGDERRFSSVFSPESQNHFRDTGFHHSIAHEAATSSLLGF